MIIFIYRHISTKCLIIVFKDRHDKIDDTHNHAHTDTNTHTHTHTHTDTHIQTLKAKLDLSFMTNVLSLSTGKNIV